MENQQLKEGLIAQLTMAGFQLDDEEKSYIYIDFRGTHRVTTYWREGMWVTFTEIVPTDILSVPFDELIEGGNLL
jgi:predicted transcriptional regulator